MHTLSVPPDTSGDSQSDFVPAINRPRRQPASPPGRGIAGPTAVSFSVIFFKAQELSCLADRQRLSVASVRADTRMASRC